MRRFLTQVKYDAAGRRFYADCPLCGSRKYAPPLLGLFPPERFRETAVLRLARYFNRCPRCGRWVCDACFDISDGEGLCRHCGEEM